MCVCTVQVKPFPPDPCSNPFRSKSATCKHTQHGCCINININVIIPRAPAIRAQVVEVVLRAGCAGTTEAADKGLATISPAHEGVHVGLAAAATHRSQLTQVNHLQAAHSNMYTWDRRVCVCVYVTCSSSSSSSSSSNVQACAPSRDHHQGRAAPKAARRGPAACHCPPVCPQWLEQC